MRKTAITARMPTITEMQAGAEELLRKCAANFGQQLDEAVVVRQARKMVRAIRPRVREEWHGR